MKAVESKDFEGEFPEGYPWNRLYVVSMEAAAQTIAHRIHLDLKTADRIYTPGLRMALRLIAEIADSEA